MSLPSFPQDAFNTRQPPASKPGIIPLRPLTVGEILGAAVQVVRRHFLLLAAASLVVSALGTLAIWGVLAGNGQIELFVTESWLSPALNGTGSIPGSVLAAAAVRLLVSVVGGVLIAGLATVCAAQDTLGKPTGRAEWRDRLTRRLPLLIGLSLLVAVAVGLGLVVLIVPGVLIYLAWLVATPVAVLERSTIGVSLNRSVQLTAGERGRLLGLVAAVLAVTVLLSFFVTSLIGGLLADLSPTGALLVSEATSAAVTLFTGPWAGAVTALAYIDLRIRKENLAPTLAAAAAVS